jgi:opacity protein-like surface antigen
MALRLARWFFCILLLITSLSSLQAQEHFNIGIGAGFTVPTGRAGDSLDTGWNVNVRGGYNFSPQFAADLDFTYTHSSLNSAALARFNEPDGSVGTWSLTFNPVVHFARKYTPVKPYVTAGYGLYYRNLQLTEPSTVQTFVCDPFFGFCFPAVVGVNQVVFSNNTLRSGFNAGGGLEFGARPGHLKFFAEARYHRMFTAHGEDYTYVPVTFGVRW